MPVATASRSVTAQESMVLTRNMMRISLSTVAFLRDFFPKSCFEDKKMSGVQMKGLLPITPESELLINWLEKGVFDALQKQYLRVVSLIVMDADEERVLESYDFKIAYPNTGPQLSVSSSTPNSTPNTPKPQGREEIAQSIRFLLRRLINLVTALPELPSERVVTMSVRYDPAVPEDYQPPFFTDASPEQLSSITQKDGYVKIALGRTVTMFHDVAMNCRAPREWLESPDNLLSQSTKEEVVVKQEEGEEGEGEVPSEAASQDAGSVVGRKRRRDGTLCGGGGGGDVDTGRTDTQLTTQTLYGDEPKVGIIERPLRKTV